MPCTTEAAVARPGTDTFSWEPVELEDPRAEEVLVRMVATGLCHTDLSVLAGQLPTPLPAVLGHEGAAVVEAVGERVTALQPGDQVLLSYNSCAHCARCRIGRPTQCVQFIARNLGATRADGSSPIRGADGERISGLFFGQSSLARHAVVSAHSVVPVPAADEDELAWLAPIGCGVQTGAGAVLNQLRPVPGDTLAVLGAGSVGLSAVLAARLSGADRIIAVDRVRSRLDLARELGATHTVHTEEAELHGELAAATDGAGVTFAVETTGVPALLEQAYQALTPYGTLAVVGAPQAGSTAAFDINAFLEGRNIIGVTEGGSDRLTFIPALVALHRQGRLPFDRLLREYSPAQLDTAVQHALDGQTLKPLIRFTSADGQTDNGPTRGFGTSPQSG